MSLPDAPHMPYEGANPPTDAGFHAEETFARLRLRRPELYLLMAQAAEIQLAKAQDYADTDSYRNLRDCEEIGVPAWKGVLIRLTDKFRRLKNFARRGEFAVKDEGFRDTCLDVVNYVLMMLVLFEQSTGEPKP